MKAACATDGANSRTSARCQHAPLAVHLPKAAHHRHTYPKWRLNFTRVLNGVAGLLSAEVKQLVHDLVSIVPAAAPASGGSSSKDASVEEEGCDISDRLNVIDGLLIQDCVDSDRRLACLPISNDELSLTPTNRDQAINCLETCSHWLMKALPWDDSWSFQLHSSTLFSVDGSLPIDWCAECIDNSTQELIPNRNIDDRACALHTVTLNNGTVISKTTTPTLSVSKFSAIPFKPLGNSTISPALTPLRP